MINRWLDKGVDGFRMDVISLLAKAPGMPDGEGEGYVFSEQYFAFQPKLHEYLREMRQNCFVGRDCMCVGETTFVTTHNANSVVGDGQELDLLFQFDIMDIDGKNGKWNVIPFDLLKLISCNITEHLAFCIISNSLESKQAVQSIHEILNTAEILHGSFI